jgi:hypothetical protein
MISLALVSLVCLGAVASPLSAPGFSEQVPIGGLGQQITTFPGFDLDLSARRLVQFEGQEPVWMTELEKVLYVTRHGTWYLNVRVQIQAKTGGIKFFDM